MHTLLRTILICLSAFLIGHIAPPKAIIVPFISILVVAGAMADFVLYLMTGRGLVHHLTSSK